MNKSHRSECLQCAANNFESGEEYVLLRTSDNQHRIFPQIDREQVPFGIVEILADQRHCVGCIRCMVAEQQWQSDADENAMNVEKYSQRHLVRRLKRNAK